MPELISATAANTASASSPYVDAIITGLGALKYWKRNKGRAGRNQGGVDIIWNADSVGQGASDNQRGEAALNFLEFSFPHLVRKKVQSKNPPGIDGGLGYMQAGMDDNAGRGAGTLQWPGLTLTNWNRGTQGLVIADHCANTSTNGATIEIAMNDATYNGASNANKENPSYDINLGTALPYHTDIEPLVFENGGSLLLSKDEGAGSYTNDSGNRAIGTSFTGCMRLGCRQNRGGFFQFSTVVSAMTGTYKVKLISMSTTSTFVEGFMLYRNDWNAGYRFWWFNRAGKGAYMVATGSIGTTGGTGEATTQRQNSQFVYLNDSTRSLESANKPTNKFIGAAVFAYGLNDYQNQTNKETPDAFYDSLDQAIAKLNTNSIKPFILLIAMHQRGGQNDSSKTYKWAEYVMRLYALQRKYDNVMVVDFWLLTGQALDTTGSGNPFCITQGWEDTHPNVKQAEAMSDIVAEIFVGSGCIAA